MIPAPRRSTPGTIQGTILPSWRSIRLTDQQDLRIPGEMPPQPPRSFFGRNELVDKITGLVGDLSPIALIGPGGIGKTSIALTILHDDRIKKQFGDDRRFIRCDQFPASLSHFLYRLSTVTGARVENPKDLTSLQPFLSSKNMFIVLDNAESILDPEGMESQEIYDAVEELSQFKNICLCITSRISTVPPDCNILDIPTLSMDAAREAFYGIFKKDKRSDAVDKILEQLEFHPLSITLLATVAYQNRWDASRLTEQWGRRRTGILRTDHKKSLAATIELSLASPMFKELGTDARGLLEVVAFFPQGIGENNLDWLFPTIPNREEVFDKFCVLSLTHRSDGFITMLAPLRDHLYPRDPKSSPLLCAIKDHFFCRLSTGTGPDERDFEETQWITSEDVNIEHLLDVFTSTDASSIDIWAACANFMLHIDRHKPRLVVLGPKVEGLPDSHPFKPRCFFTLSGLMSSVGNFAGGKQLLVHALNLWRERGDHSQVARTLTSLAYTNRALDLLEEGILQAKEAVEIYGELDDKTGQARSLQTLALLLAKDGQVDAAEEAASRMVDLSPDEPSQSQLCQHYHTLAHIHDARGEIEVAIGQYKKSLEIASSLNHYDQVSLLRCFMVVLFGDRRFDDAQVYLERLKSNGANDPPSLFLSAMIQAYVWGREGRFEEVRSEMSRVAHALEKVGASGYFVGDLDGIIEELKEDLNNPLSSDADKLVSSSRPRLPLTLGISR